MTIDGREASNGEAIRVVSWNIEFGRRPAEAVRALISQPALRGADVMLLQEMDPAGVQVIADALGLDSHYASACIHPKSGRPFGNAVLTRRPLSHGRVAELPHRGSVQGTPRVSVGASIIGTTGEIELWSCHTETAALRNARRLDQFRAVASAANTMANRRAIVGGDFNTLTARGIGSLSSIMAGVGATRIDTGRASTLRRSGRSFTLDHLFVRGFGVREAGVGNPMGASDHAPIWAHLTPT